MQMPSAAGYAACSSIQASRLGFLKNCWLLGGLVTVNLLQLAVVSTAPMNRLFHTVPISLTHFSLIGGVASTVLWTEELRKWFARRKMQNAPQVG